MLVKAHHTGTTMKDSKIANLKLKMINTNKQINIQKNLHTLTTKLMKLVTATQMIAKISTIYRQTIKKTITKTITSSKTINKLNIKKIINKIPT